MVGTVIVGITNEGCGDGDDVREGDGVLEGDDVLEGNGV